MNNKINIHTGIDSIRITISSRCIDNNQSIVEDLIRLINSKKPDNYLEEDSNEYYKYTKCYIKGRYVFSIAQTVTSRLIGDGKIINGKTRKNVIYEYFIHISFAGLKSYNMQSDTLKEEIMLLVFGFLNDYTDLSYTLSAIDVYVDIDAKFDKVLATCVKKTPNTRYYTVDEQQLFQDTRYIEKFLDDFKLKTKRAYLYNKSLKERIDSKNITRFELKLQPKFFKNKNFLLCKILENKICMTYETLEKIMNNYYILYCPTNRILTNLLNKLKYIEDNKIKFRDISKCRLERYRIIPDYSQIYDFLKKILGYSLVNY